MKVGRWVRRARLGDHRALRVLYDAHLPGVYGYCKAFCGGDGDRGTALAQEVFVEAFSALGDLRDDNSFSGWLMAMARRACRRWNDQASEGQPISDGALVADAIEACPHQAPREAARLFYADPPHSTQEIATALGVSHDAVTTRLQRFHSWARAHRIALLASTREAS